MSPDTWNVFRHLISKGNPRNKSILSTYLAFKDYVYHSGDPNLLCSLVHEDITKEVIGGLCIYGLEQDTVVIYILCSNRSLGQKILDHVKSWGKTVMIDEPLPEVQSFYQHLGFQWLYKSLNHSRMIYRHPNP